MTDGAGAVAWFASKGIVCENVPIIEGRNFYESPIRFFYGVALNNIKIGAFSYASRSTFIIQSEIGRYCSIATEVYIGTGRHPLNRISTHPFSYSDIFGTTPAVNLQEFNSLETTVIGHDVLIGINVVILDGVRVGDGAVIAAGSVVTRDVPPYSVVAGSPAIVKRMRFSDKIINRLLDLKWWRFDMRAAMQENVIKDWSNIDSAIVQIEDASCSGKLKEISGSVSEISRLGEEAIYKADSPVRWF